MGYFIPVLACVCAVTFSVTHASSPSITTNPWSHGWTDASQSWWGDFGYSLLNDQQATFVANNYAVACLEKCTGNGQGLKTEDGIYQTARQLKKINPKVKVMFYLHTGLAAFRCYANKQVYEAHPEWWLRDDNGNVVDGHFDFTIKEAAEWFVSIPLAAADAADIIDGVLLDGAGFEKTRHISTDRLEQLMTAKLDMAAQLQAEFDKLGRGGVVMGNGFSEYNQSPTDPHHFRILDSMHGILNEHFAAFEQVDRRTGALNKDKVSDVLDNIEFASTSNSSKQVFCSFWAGHYVGFSSEPGPGHGWPKYFDNSQPCGSKSSTGTHCTRDQLYSGWRQQLEKYLPFNLAAFLTVAQANTWFTQAVWYQDQQGFMPCPDRPNSCALGDSFYADYLKKPLGSPKGLRKKVSAYKWTREFEHATVTLDLNNPLGGSGIVFH